MILYNIINEIINGIDPATIFILPMLGEKHPSEYPRFRDCFVEDDEIHVFTRVGGGNRNCGYGEEELREHPNYLREFDDDFDDTYATYVFSVPDEFKEDFELVKMGRISRIKETSQKYRERLYKVYPELKDVFDKIFA